VISRLSLFLCALAILPLAAAAQAPGTDDPLPPNATWDTLRRVFHDPNTVDDGSAAETFSDFVVHRLATRWSTVRSLASLVARDSAFGTFVIKHVDATTDTTELRRVLDHATQSCPPAAKSLCSALQTAARRAIAEAAQPN